MAKIRYKKVCEYCGIEFETTIKHKKYCSYICADEMVHYIYHLTLDQVRH